MNESDIKAALSTVHSDHEYDCARFEVESGDGETLTLEYTTDKAGSGYLWNITSGDLPLVPERYSVLDSGRRYVLVESNDLTVEGARIELEELRLELAGDGSSIASLSTFRTASGNIIEDLNYLLDRLVRSIAGVVR